MRLIGRTISRAIVESLTAPVSPDTVSASVGNAQATISWATPYNGGSPITGYTVKASDGTTRAASSSPFVFTGLTNGVAYTFQVLATNAIGNGVYSAPSNSVTPAAIITAPNPPTGVSAAAGDTTATVSWTDGSDGGSAITGYTVKASDGTTQAATSSPYVFTGLTDGTAYTFQVLATNAVGDGAYSAASNSVTPSSATVPGAPTIGAASAGDASATVRWSAPGANGGSAITGYDISGSPAGSASAGSGVTSKIVGGLTNGTGYKFIVRALNAIGYGPWSNWSNSVTPAAAATVPGAPVVTIVSPGNAQVTIYWNAPSNNGGSAITGYKVKCSNGVTHSVSTSASPYTFTGLTNGVSYSFNVLATNAVGDGPWSSSSGSATPSVPQAGVTAPDISVGTIKPAIPSGSSHATVSGGVGPFSYSWAWVSGGTGITLTGASSSTVTATSSGGLNKNGTLRCSVTDSGNGNKVSTANINVSLTQDSGA